MVVSLSSRASSVPRPRAGAQSRRSRHCWDDRTAGGGPAGHRTLIRRVLGTHWRGRKRRPSTNGDALVWGTMAALSVLFVFVPFIPGLRSIPRYIPVYRLIRRQHHRELREPGQRARPNLMSEEAGSETPTPPS